MNDWAESHHTSERLTEEHQSWALSLDDHMIVISRSPSMGSDFWEVSISVRQATPGRLSLLKLYPRFVGELEALNGALPSLLILAAEKMRSMGLDDLRPEYERRSDALRDKKFFRARVKP